MLKNKKIIALILVLVALGVGGFFGYRTYRNSQEKPKDNWQEGVNYRPPTEEEKAAGDEQKQAIDEQESNSQQNSPQNQAGKKQVSVIITDAGQYDGIIEVRSFVPDHFQDGTCTITFTKDSQTLVKQTPAKTDVSTTICLDPNIKRSEFKTAGDWQLKVVYSSSDATGTSEAKKVTIK